MAAFRKRPVIVEADRHLGPGSITVATLEGPLLARPGDWIVTGIEGERYPCRDDIFRRTYEPLSPIDSGLDGSEGE